ncbi:MAG: CpaD family pilus assembly protein [Alphaproteobacteria bacterium]|nr:CpaD family pilus assembly protein [Alphaproteobacteria bacterium]
MSKWSERLRLAALAATLLAGSCASDDGDRFLSSDGAQNHPIVVQPSDRSLRLPFSAPDAGLMPEDSARLEGFVSDYLMQGSGAISVSAPEGPDSRVAIAYFGERLARMGVPRGRILVGTHDARDNEVQLDFIGYEAHTDKCGDWSQNLSDTAANDTSPNFGCAVQQNIAAMVTNPRDLASPQAEESADAARRSVALQHYEKGEVTSATKGKDQSGAVADVGGGGGGGQ